MKRLNNVMIGLIALISLMPGFAMAQEEEKASPFSVGADFYSNYVWRGTRFGNGPAFQPSIKYTIGGLTAGIWGSFDASGYQEADPFISYSLPFGLSLGITDYYYCGDFTELSDTAGNHAFEGNLGYTIGGLSLSANYIFNEAGGAASAGGDKYFQATYNFKNFNLFLGAGDGWHTSDGDFAVCNVGLGTSKTIEITDKFSIPVTGQLIVNPEKKQMFMVVGFTF